MRAELQAGAIYLGLAAGLLVLWLSGAGARQVQTLRDAAAGKPSARFRIAGYRRPPTPTQARQIPR